MARTSITPPTNRFIRRFPIGSFAILGICLGIVLITYSFRDVSAKTPGSLAVTDDNWNSILEGQWMVKFYAPWCPACRNLEPTWKSLSLWGEGKQVNFAQVDVTEQSGLSGRFIVTSLPTIYHVINGEFRQYTGPRTLDDFMSFIDEQKWKEVDPMPWWKSPSSHLMGFVSGLFKLSMQLKNLHTSLTDTYGLPVWASFVAFAVLIVIFGLLLGMLMVLGSDYLFGPPPPPDATEVPVEVPGDDEQPTGDKEVIDEVQNVAQPSETKETDEEKMEVDEEENQQMTEHSEESGVRKRMVKQNAVIE